MKILNKKQIVLGILIFLSLVVLGLSAYIIYSLNNEEENLNIALEDSPVKIENTEEETNESIYVEVKGAVQNPGVYAMNEQDLINDAINLAGGFLDNAYTDNINLSKKVTDELVALSKGRLGDKPIPKKNIRIVRILILRVLIMIIK